MLLSALAIGICILMYTEGDLSANGFKNIAWPKLQNNFRIAYNKTRETFTSENIKYASIRVWETSYPIMIYIKDASFALILTLKDAAINCYETLKTGDLEIYAAGLKNCWNSFVKFSIQFLEFVQEKIRQIDWQAILQGKIL